MCSYNLHWIIEDIEDKYGHLHKSCCVRKLIILSELGCAKVTQYFLTKQVFNESSEVALVQLRICAASDLESKPCPLSLGFTTASRAALLLTLPFHVLPYVSDSHICKQVWSVSGSTETDDSRTLTHAKHASNMRLSMRPCVGVEMKYEMSVEVLKCWNEIRNTRNMKHEIHRAGVRGWGVIGGHNGR